MLKTIVLIGLAAALVVPSVPAFAVNGDSSSYGTEGYGPTVPTQSLTPSSVRITTPTRARCARELGRPGFASTAASATFSRNS